MIVRAEMRMADEIDRGQERGEVASKGRDKGNVHTPDISTFDDLGVDRQRVAEWRKTRDAGEAVVEDAIEAALADGRAPTKADIQRAVATRYLCGTA